MGFFIDLNPILINLGLKTAQLFGDLKLFLQFLKSYFVLSQVMSFKNLQKPKRQILIGYLFDLL